MDFQVLGPLRARDGDVEVDLGGPKQRLVLAILLAARGASVTTDALIDGVWRDDAPASARKTLQGYVHHLRSRISGGLETDKSGYSLSVRDDRIDERCFTAALDTARPLVETDPRMASDTLSMALSLWKGTPYADLDGAPVLLPEITRLDEARLVALGDRIDADLALGRHDLLIAELESLTIDYPLQERFRVQHMLALYRSGRHGEALRAYARTRAQFVEEMGIEPSDRLSNLEHQILERDPALDISVTQTPATARAVRGYELREEIVRNRLGILYRGYQRSVGREVAIRMTGAEAANAPEFISAFESDVARIAQLDHPHVAYVHDAWREPGRAYQVTRWIEGERLDTVLETGPMSDHDTLRLLEQVGGALAFANRAGVVHGRVGADAVVCSRTGDAFLTDFSAGRPLGSIDDDRTGFVRLAFHVLFGVEPPTGRERRPLADSVVTSPETAAVFECALADPAAKAPDDLVLAIRRSMGREASEFADVVGEPTGRSDARCPFKGLHAFQTSDAGDFFGRDDLVDRLHRMLLQRRLVAVVGASGSGKSSLVRAGLVPRVRSGQQIAVVAEMFPGADPFDALARALRSVAVVDTVTSEELLADPRGLVRAVDDALPDEVSNLVLVIDQFEEVFTAVASEQVRTLFLDSLVTAVSDPESRVRVVLTLRADFFDRPLRYAEFGALVESGLVPVAMPDTEGLAAAIEGPADLVGVRLEPGLVGEMIRDIADEPGGLPLVQYALTDLFARREADILTIEAYRRSGGVLGALAGRAESLYSSLDPIGQRAIQQAFLQMIAIGEGAGHVRRRVNRAELHAMEIDAGALEEGLQRFGAHRLVTFDSDPISRAPTVEVAHESLLVEWERLRRWIEEQQDELVVRRRLDAAVQEWEDSGEHSAYLLQGRRLAEFDAWADDTEIALSGSERSFLETSREYDERQTRSALTRRRRMTIALAVAAGLALVFAVFTLLQRNEIADDAFDSETARLASDAGFVMEDDRQSALLMAVEAYDRDPGFESLSALERVLVGAGAYLGNLGAGNQYHDVRWLAPGRLLAVGRNEVHLFDVTTRQLRVLPIDRGPISEEVHESSAVLASSPAGLAVIETGDGPVVLVDAVSNSVSPLPAADGAAAIAIDPDGSRMAIGHSDGSLRLVERSTSTVLAEVTAHAVRGAERIPLGTVTRLDDAIGSEVGGVDTIRFSPDGSRILTSGDVFVRMWNADDLSPIGPEIVHVEGDDEFNLVATPPGAMWADLSDDDAIVVAGDAHLVRWDAKTGERTSLDAVTGDVVDALPAGDDRVIFLFEDGRLVRRSIETVDEARDSVEAGADLVFDTQEADVRVFDVDREARRAAVATDDGLVLVSLDGDQLIASATPIGSSTSPSLTADGGTLAGGLATDGLVDLTTDPPVSRYFDVPVETAHFGAPATIELVRAGPRDVLIWTSELSDLRNGYDLDTQEYIGDFWGAFIPAWSDDGTRVARARRSGGTRVGDTVGEWEGYETSRTMVAGDFDTSGNRLALAFADGSAAVVDLSDGSEVAVTKMPSRVVSLAFTSDDSLVIVIDADGTVWAVDPPSGRMVRTLADAGPASDDPVAPPVFSPDGTLMFAGLDGIARLWHVESGRHLGLPLSADPGGRSSGTWDRDVMRVVTPVDGDALIWDLDVANWVERACTAAGRDLTDAEWAVVGPRDTDRRATCTERLGEP